MANRYRSIRYNLKRHYERVFFSRVGAESRQVLKEHGKI